MFLGRFQQGEAVTLPLLAIAGTAGAPGLPDVSPALMVYNQAGVRLLSAPVPPRDRYKAPGHFAYRLLLGASYPPGKYMAAVVYRTAGSGHLRTHCFEVIEGGDPAGAVVSLFRVERPQGRFLVTRTDAGTVGFGRNPGV